MEVTSNFKLKKPSLIDNVDINVLNENFDKIDVELKKAINASYDFENFALLIGAEYKAMFLEDRVVETVKKESSVIANRTSVFLSNGNIEVYLVSTLYGINSKTTYRFTDDSVTGEVSSQ